MPFLGAGLARQFDLVRIGQFAVPDRVHSLVFFLSALTALAGPIFIRTLFANATKGKTRISVKTFLFFQKKILWVSLVAPYFAFMAYLCDFPRFYAGAVLLMAMYSAYYYFPSEKRISFDKKIFRVE